MSGSDTKPPAYVGVSGVYGTKGVAAPGNVPGARTGSVGWTDSHGNLWLFGGTGFYSGGSGGNLNDLWMFNPTTLEWTWVSGSKTAGASGVFGTKGVPSTANVPGAWFGGITWTDSGDDLWLYGGVGDVWKFKPVTNEWTWVGGYATPPQYIVWGTKGVPSTANSPLGGCCGWTDSSGNFWLYLDGYNAIWKFNPTDGTWTWVSGSDVFDWLGNYGTLGVGSTANHPAERIGTAFWIDAGGNLWLNGGAMNIASPVVRNGDVNDLWEFNPVSNEWTWVKGSNPITSGVNPGPVYGLLGVPSPSNTPGGRDSSASWLDDNGNLWLYGGESSTSSEIGGNINDMWEFDHQTRNWIWVSGGGQTNLIPVYGTLNVPDPDNTPGPRAGAVSWTDKYGNFWLFGGVAPSGPGTYGYLNDLWRYRP